MWLLPLISALRVAASSCRLFVIRRNFSLSTIILILLWSSDLRVQFLSSPPRSITRLGLLPWQQDSILCFNRKSRTKPTSSWIPGKQLQSRCVEVLTSSVPFGSSGWSKLGKQTSLLRPSLLLRLWISGSGIDWAPVSRNFSSSIAPRTFIPGNGVFPVGNLRLSIGDKLERLSTRLRPFKVSSLLSCPTLPWWVKISGEEKWEERVGGSMDELRWGEANTITRKRGRYDRRTPTWKCIRVLATKIFEKSFVGNAWTHGHREETQLSSG